MIIRVRGGSAQEIYAGAAQAAAFWRSFVYLAEGGDGREIVRMDLRSGARRSVARAPIAIGSLAVSPRGTRIAGVHWNDQALSPNDDRMFVLTLGRRGPTRSVAIGSPSFNGELAWQDEMRLAALSYEARSYVFDNRLGKVGDFDLRAEDAVVDSGVAYGLTAPLGKAGAWSLQAAKLPNGRIRRVGTLPRGRPTVIATVPGEADFRAARRSFCLALERVFPPIGM